MQQEKQGKSGIKFIAKVANKCKERTWQGK